MTNLDCHFPLTIAIGQLKIAIEINTNLSATRMVRFRTACIDFWMHIMSWARDNGIIVYEQDWLNVAYERGESS